MYRLKQASYWLILFFGMFFFEGYACSYAYQYSLFPLGNSGGEIIFLEVELERYVNGPASAMMMPMNGNNFDKNKIETRWKGNLRLKSSPDLKNLKLLADLAYIDIADEDYKAALLPHFERAMEKARELPFFEEALLEKTASCAYDRTCTMFQMEVDSVNPALYCYLPDSPQQKTKVAFPPLTLKKYENVTQLNFSEIESVETTSQVEFYKVWKPCSARYYKIGAQELVIYTIGWGQKKGYLGQRNADWKENLLPVENFIEGNDVMMHGQRFDICQIL